jgi:hypothetical protein
MAQQQPHQLGAGVPGRSQHPDFHLCLICHGHHHTFQQLGKTTGRREYRDEMLSNAAEARPAARGRIKRDAAPVPVGHGGANELSKRSSS